MIPLIQSQQPQSSPKRYVPTHLSFVKLNTLDDFMSIKSNAIVDQSPSPHEEGPKVEAPQIMIEEEQEVKIPEAPVFKKPYLSSLTDFLKDKKEILIPFAKKIQPSPCRFLDTEGMIFKQRKTQNNYIRFDYGRAMPSGDVYEATDKDLNFISQLNNQFLDGCQASEGTIKFTQHQFERLIAQWEHATSDGDLISLEQALAISREESAETDTKMEEIHTKVYEYWKGLRELYHRPLLRRYLKSVNKDLTNPNIAFLRRKENKFARRRSQRMSSPEEDFKRMKNLKKNMGRGLLLLGNVKYREMLKLEQEEIKIKMFHQQLKEELGEADDFITQVAPTISQQKAYQEARKKMEEDNNKAEIILKSLKRLKEGAIKSVAKSAKRKLSLTQLSSASLSTVTSADALMTPLTDSENKFENSYLPKNIEGSFKLPIKKSAIQLSDLKLRLTQSLGGLYLKNQEEIRVKVDVMDMDKKEHVDAVKSEEDGQEELAIKVEIEDDADHKGNENSPSTTVRYSICFGEPAKQKAFSFRTEEKTQEQSEVSHQSEDLQLDACLPMSQEESNCLSLPTIYAGNC